ncbi:hypothetical protein QAD02_005417 [Eretmocerus hayati]|uniref:Uncharacterized protein n=1 Tax=Eretmocerus hayati TaxID=131215 RepID=A0ACC2NSA0_9HYME|nr:hypothetical protein QAD02_005417 [Eretmocerus hayati]
MPGIMKAKDFPLHVVEFVNPGRKPRQKSLDVVRTKWFKREGKKTMVYFPKPPYTSASFDAYNAILAGDEAAPKEWGLFTMKVRARAETLPEALEKLEALKTNEAAVSLSDGTMSDYEREVDENIARSDLQDQAASLLQSHQSSSLESSAVTRDTSEMAQHLEVTSASNNSNTATADSFAQSGPSSISGNIGPASATSHSAIPAFVMPSTSASELQTLETDSIEYETRRRETSLKRSRDSRQGKEKSISSSKLLKDLVKQVTNLNTEVKALSKKVDGVGKEVGQMKAVMSHKLSGIITEGFITTPQQIAKKYNYKIPLQTLEDFERFDQELRNPNSSLYDDVVIVLQSGLDSQYVIPRSIVKMLKMFLTRSVAMEFVGQRPAKTGEDVHVSGDDKASKDGGKKPMNKTKFFEIMELIITNHRATAGIKTGSTEVTTRTGKVLSNARNWKECYYFESIESDSTSKSSDESSMIPNVPSKIAMSSNSSGVQSLDNVPVMTVPHIDLTNSQVVLCVQQEDHQPLPKQRKLVDSDEIINQNTNNHGGLRHVIRPVTQGSEDHEDTDEITLEYDDSDDLNDDSYFD